MAEGGVRPQHSQSLEALFAHIPGGNPKNAKGILISSIEDKSGNNFEHRWLHEVRDFVQKYFKTKLGKAEIVKKGKNITLMSALIW